jgi:hypothetical protein
MDTDAVLGDEWTMARITEEKLAAARAKIGRVRREPGWNSVVTPDTIRHFALGLGDDNPLYWDEAYAARSPCGRITAISTATSPNVVYDVQWITGEVTAVDLEAGNLTLHITTTNQLGETTSRSRATVELPRR